ncbi:MAG: hypothetical protein FJW61_01420 [Actinobacteria bacterium]|nr:hypothetical protein [Actinomycetota bacterium]
MQYSRLSKILILLIFISSLLFFQSCKYESLGLSLDSEELTSETTIENTVKQIEVSPEQNFFELLGKQKDKNPLKNINIRNAIFYAIDRERIVEELLGSYGSVRNSLFLPDSIFYSPAWSNYSFDLEKAGEYLRLAGYGKDNPLYLTIGASSGSPSRKVAEGIIKENLEKIGIILWVADKDSKDWYVDNVKNGNYDLGIWAIFTPDCESLANYFSSEKIPPLETEDNRNCYNFYWYKNQDFDNYIKNLCEESELNVKKEIAEQVQSILSKDAVILPLYSRIFAVAFNKKVQNIDINTNDGNFLENMEEVSIDMDLEDKKKTETSGKTDDRESEDIEYMTSIVVGFGEEPYTLNPFVSNNIYGGYITSMLIESLWKKGSDGEYKEVLVEEIIKGERVLNIENEIRRTLRVQIKLRNNIYWEDGSEINAGDVIATILAIQADETLNNTHSDYKKIKKIEELNEKEFLVTFNEYDTKWKDLFSVVLPKNIIESNKLTELFEDNLFSSGPYKLREWVRGQHILLESNPYYFGKSPEINAVKFIFNSDINYLIEMLREGNLDILSIPADIKLMEDIEANKDLGLLVKPGKLWEHLAICLKPKEE